MKIRLVKKKKKVPKPPLELTAVQLIKDKFAYLKLKFIDRPLDAEGNPLNPRLPRDLTRLNDVQLGKLYGEFCLMAQFCQLRLAVLGVEKSSARQAEKVVRAESQLRREGTVADKAAQVEIDPRVRERSLAVLVEEGVEKLSEAFLESFIIGRDALSREMSRRQWTTKDPYPNR